MVCFQRILMPVDADRYPKEVVEAALSLARLSGGNITALCVASGDETEALAACSVGRAAEAGAAAGIGIDPATSDGDPSEIIIERSRDHDVIVMGSGRKKLLSDSTANTVVRSAHCPVIVVRPQR